MRIGLGLTLTAFRSVEAFTYLLRDLFTTDQAAGAVNGTAAEPGPGTRVVNDTGSKISISAGKLRGGGAGTWGATTWYLSQPVTRAAGRTLIFTCDWTASGLMVFGLRRSLANFGNTNDYNDFSDSAWSMNLVGAYELTHRSISTALSPLLATLSPGVEYQLAIALRSAGSFFFIKGGAFSQWTLLWVEKTVTTATLYVSAAINGASTIFNTDNVRVLDLPQLDADSKVYTSRLVSPVAGATATMEADAVLEFTSNAATGVTQEWMVRRTDDNNCWIVRMDQAGSTVKLIEKVAGVETERGSAAQTWTNTTAYRVVVIAEASVIKVFVANTLKLTYSSAASNATATGMKVSTAGADLIAWPRAFALPSGV